MNEIMISDTAIVCQHLLPLLGINNSFNKIHHTRDDGAVARQALYKYIQMTIDARTLSGNILSDGYKQLYSSSGNVCHHCKRHVCMFLAWLGTSSDSKGLL